MILRRLTQHVKDQNWFAVATLSVSTCSCKQDCDVACESGAASS